MAALPAQASKDQTLEAVRAAVELRAAEEEQRPYLGMSGIGGECTRRLWYGFRGAAREKLTADSIYNIEDGHRCEEVQAGRLRLVKGIHLQTLDPRTGKQFGFVDLGGHFKGHADGMISGLIQAPKTLHIWEHKSVGGDKQGKLEKLKAAVDGEKAALAKWDSTYYAQAVLYMAYSETTRHYLTCSTPGARTVISVRTDTNLDMARQLRSKAERIIKAAEPPERITMNPGWWECGYCPAKLVCHGSAVMVNGKLEKRMQLPMVNCRTCAHATPEMNGQGRWSCAWHKRDLTKDEQRAACQSHRYIPALVTIGKPTDADPMANWIEYTMPDGRVFRNGDPGERSYTSEELRNVDIAQICDPSIELLRQKFDARIVQAA